MSFVITQSCAGVCDTGCVDVCPVDCIAGPVPLGQLRAVAPSDRATRFPSVQMYIDPAQCVGCGACVPECPEDAIRSDAELLDNDPDLLRNAHFFNPRISKGG
ncbi:MAG: 4Fe-4S binding protein [Nannocystales bacterium]